MKVYTQLESGMESPYILKAESVKNDVSIVATLNIGGIKKGDTFNDVQSLLTKLITPYKECSIDSISKGTTYERGSGTKTANVTVTYSVNSDPVTEFKINGVAQTNPTVSGSKTVAISINTNDSAWNSKDVTATIKDAKMTSVSSKSTTFKTEGWMKVFFSPKTSLTVSDLEALDSQTVSSSFIKRQFSSSQITIDNTANEQYLYVVIPSSYSISLTDSMNTPVEMNSAITVSGVKCNGQAITETYKVYRATKTSNKNSGIIYKIIIK